MGALEEDIGQDQAQRKFDIRSILSAKPSQFKYYFLPKTIFISNMFLTIVID